MPTLTKTSGNPDAQYTTKYENLSFAPVFIMGIQRSGTSILYKILSETQSFNIITAYHLIKYPELIHLHETN
ncbi:MAG: sulfotransferase, partial [Candidatus Thermoplasmatota archaeon]|nr:sulfotransferase [Candidatus Thermoplasmatota archaeon]